MRIMVGKLTGTCGSGILNFSQVAFRSRRKRENDREREREREIEKQFLFIFSGIF